MSTFGGWTYTCDRAATVRAYSQASTGGVDKCTCNGCRNFVLVRDEVFPAAFVDEHPFARLSARCRHYDSPAVPTAGGALVHPGAVAHFSSWR